jgi:two-component system OmpR family response regulator
VLDLGLPELDGLDVCKQLRQHNTKTAILMLTARNAELDRVLGLELGADDYMGKPFSLHELHARVRALLRRQAQLQNLSTQDSAGRQLNFVGLTIDPASHEVHCRGQAVSLTAREFDLLFFLASNAGHVYSREQLLNSIWGYTSGVYEHTVNSNINRLRNKLELDPANPDYILTVRGVGYKFHNGAGGA